MIIYYTFLGMDILFKFRWFHLPFSLIASYPRFALLCVFLSITTNSKILVKYIYIVLFLYTRIILVIVMVRKIKK